MITFLSIVFYIFHQIAFTVEVIYHKCIVLHHFMLLMQAGSQVLWFVEKNTFLGEKYICFYKITKNFLDTNKIWEGTAPECHPVAMGLC